MVTRFILINYPALSPHFKGDPLMASLRHGGAITCFQTLAGN